MWSEETLRKMPESELCQKVLVPLFEAMGYREVEYRHGGARKRLRNVARGTPKGRINYAVVVKAKKITGAAGQGTHKVLMQIKQSLGSNYTDKKTLEEQRIHQCLVVSSHEIKKEGANSFRSLLVHENLIGRVFTIDGQELWNLIRQLLPQHTIHRQLESAYEALGTIHPDYDFAVALKPGERHFDLIPKHPEAEPIPVSFFPIFPDTPEGQMKKEQFQQFVETGARVELDQENIRFEDLPDPMRLLFPFAKEGEYTIVLGPSQLTRPIPMSLTIDSDSGTSFALPWIVFTHSQRGSRSMTLTNEGQAIPVKVELRFSEHNHSIGVNYHFHFGGQCIYWLVQGTHFQNVLAGGARLTFRDLRTGIALSPFRVPPGIAQDWGEDFTRIAEKILEIQDRLKITIVIPERRYFSDKDVAQMLLIDSIIRTGRAPVGIENVTGGVNFKNERDAASRLVDGFEKEPRADIFFRLEQQFETLLDQVIPLGPVEVRIPAARTSPESLEKLRRAAAGKNRRGEIRLRLMAGEGHSIDISFPKWLESESEPNAMLRETGTSARRKRVKDGNK